MRLNLFLITFTLTILFQVSVAYVVDPLQAFRKATWYRPDFTGKESFYLPGLIKYYDYTVALIGSSVAQNTSAKQVGELFHGRTLKVTIAGLHGEEFGDALHLILAEKKATVVLLNLDISCYHGADLPRRHPSIWPHYAYTTERWASWPYLFNVPDVWASLIKTIKKNFHPSYASASLDQEWDTLWSWESVKQKSRMRLGEQWKEMVDAPKADNSGVDLNQWLEAFNRITADPIQQHPNVHFFAYFPPYSILYWNGSYLRGNIDLELAFKRKMLERLLELPNVEIYDYQSEPTLIWNLNHYYDITHFDSAYDTFEIAHLLQSRYQVTRENMESRLSDLRTQASHCSVIGSDALWK